LEEILCSIDVAPFEPEMLLEPAREGLRRALANHAGSPEPAGRFATCAAELVRASVASFIDDSGSGLKLGEGGGTSWASDRLAWEAFAGIDAHGSATDPALWRAVRERERAIAILVGSHMQLLRSVVASRSGRGTDDEDLMQQGVIALRRAAESFVADRGAAFSTHATNVIRNEFNDVTRRASGCTANASRLIAEFSREKWRIFRETGAMPSREQVFDGLLWSPTKRGNYQKAVAACDRQSLDELTGVGPGVRSLSRDPLEDLIRREDEKFLSDALDSLGPDERQLITAKYYGPAPLSLKERAARVFLSPAELQKREAEVEGKLRQRLGLDRRVGS
jgi:RNA polymerase sigma factor (sigma-70 family)